MRTVAFRAADATSTRIFIFLFVCYAVVHQNLGWNQNSRLDLLHSLFIYRTFSIDSYHENTGDKSYHDGHFYSDKAPGTVFLALPAFFVALSALSLLNVPLNSADGFLFSSWITTAGSVGLITAIGGAAMFALLFKFVGRRVALITTLATFLGSAPFPYATMLFSHAAVVGLLSISLWAIADGVFVRRLFTSSETMQRQQGLAGVCVPQGPIAEDSAHWISRHVLAGICCGLAVASEYTSALAAAGVLLLTLLTSYRRALVVASAAVLPALLVPAYNWICFGSPLAFGYHCLALPEFQAMNTGLFGITFPPKATSAYLLLFSPERGLFFWTPFYLIACCGLFSLWRCAPKVLTIAACVIVFQIVCISGYYMPDGGASLGPRHLAPLLPFLVLVAAFGVRRFPVVGYVLGFYSIALTGLGTLICAMPPPSLPTGLWDFFLTVLSHGGSARNLLSQSGLAPVGSIGVIFTLILSAYFLWPVHTAPDQVLQERT